MGDLETEVLSLPFDGFNGEAEHCRLVVQRQRKEKGTQLDCFEEGGDDMYVYRAIQTNEWDMTEEEVIEFYNQRGAKEKVFDQNILTVYTDNVAAFESIYADYG